MFALATPMRFNLRLIRFTITLKTLLANPSVKVSKGAGDATLGCR